MEKQTKKLQKKKGSVSGYYLKLLPNNMSVSCSYVIVIDVIVFNVLMTAINLQATLKVNRNQCSKSSGRVKIFEQV